MLFVFGDFIFVWIWKQIIYTAMRFVVMEIDW